MGGTLYGIHYSPWSLRARWALDLRGVPYAYREHLPMMGEPALRARLGAWRGKVTLPAFVDGETVLRDSLEIARLADRRGEGPALFPESHEADVVAWSERAEALAEDGRVRTTARTADDTEALVEAVPFPVPRPVALVVGRVGVVHLRRKYRFGAGALAERERAMRETLEAARRAIGDGEHLVGDALTFADLALAAALQFVGPLGPPRVELKPHALKAWVEPSLSAEFADLLAWRDRLVERHPFVPRP